MSILLKGLYHSIQNTNVRLSKELEARRTMPPRDLSPKEIHQLEVNLDKLETAQEEIIKLLPGIISHSKEDAAKVCREMMKAVGYVESLVLARNLGNHERIRLHLQHLVYLKIQTQNIIGDRAIAALEDD